MEITWVMNGDHIGDKLEQH